jgi:hypothetical protein
MVAGSCAGNTLGSYQAICTQPPWASDATAEQVPIGEWLRLVVDDEQQRADCTGKPLELAELPLRCAIAARPGTPRNLPLRTDDAKIRSLPGGFGLFWIPFEGFTNGDHSLLVALVHTSKRALSVVGIGTVRLPPEQTDMDLQAMKGEDVLFASGAGCVPGEGSKKCERTLKPQLLHQGRFMPLELRAQDNSCHGETYVALTKSQEIRLETGWVRRFELTSTYELTNDSLVVNEQLVAMDRPPSGDETNSRLFRSSDARRDLEFTGAYFVYQQQSLWDGMRELRGDVRPGASKGTGR